MPRIGVAVAQAVFGRRPSVTKYTFRESLHRKYTLPLNSRVYIYSVTWNVLVVVQLGHHWGLNVPAKRQLARHLPRTPCRRRICVCVLLPGSNALMTAVRCSAPLSIEFLLQNGVNVNATTDPDRNTPLHVAAQLCHIDCIKVMPLLYCCFFVCGGGGGGCFSCWGGGAVLALFLSSSPVSVAGLNVFNYVH